MNNKCLSVALAELRYLFNSPIAWVMFAAFFVLTANAFVDAMETIANAEMRGAPQVTTVILFQDLGVFGSVYTNLLLYIPLLTMGVLSRDQANGTIHLLMSSPINISHIVFGKYLALLVIVSVFLILTTIFAIVANTYTNYLDWPHIGAGLLGMYLLASTYAAIGVFISSLTNHQVVAAIGTVVFLGLLSAVGALGQTYPVVDEVAYWLSISGRAELMMNGLIASKDVAYFFILTLMFLAFTLIRLEARRSKASSRMMLNYGGAVLLSGLLLGYVTSLYKLTVFFDTTHNKTMSLSSSNEEALEAIDFPVTITVLVNVLDVRSGFFDLKYRRNIKRSMFERFERAIGPIDIRYQYYFADTEDEQIYEVNPSMTNEEIARKVAYQKGLNFESFLTQPEVVELYGLDKERFLNVYVVEGNGRRAVLRNFHDAIYYPQERQIATALSLLVEDPVRVGYITDGDSRSAFRSGLEDHSSLVTDVTYRFSLVNQGFSTLDVSLDRPLPGDLDILVLAAPKEQLTQMQMSNLESFVRQGGNLLALIDRPNGLNDEFLADLLGVRQSSTSVLQQEKAEFPSDLIFARLAEQSAMLGYDMPSSRPEWPILMPRPIQIEEAEDAGYSFARLVTVPHGSLSASVENGDLQDPLSFALAARPSKLNPSQRIVVAGDADFMSNAVWSMQRPARVNNTSLILSMFYYLGEGQYPIVNDGLPRKDRGLLADLRDVNKLRVILVAAIPLLIIMLGAFVLWRRKRSS